MVPGHRHGPQAGVTKLNDRADVVLGLTWLGHLDGPNIYLIILSPPVEILHEVSRGGALGRTSSLEGQWRRGRGNFIFCESLSNYRCNLGHLFLGEKVEKDASSRGKDRGSAPEKDKAKGKEPTKEAVEGLHHRPTMKELCEMGDRAGDVKYFIARVSNLPGLKVGALVKNEVLDLKSGLGLKVMAAIEKQTTDLEAKLARTKTALRDAEQCCQSSEKEAEQAQGVVKNLKRTNY
ncbi:hypothetical protein BHM03_00007594 [Ensete ventricosum]|nr:hypothetical protein BHM03_00007594 [Ensete ventricosum]